jgi:hypothetical protein
MIQLDFQELLQRRPFEPFRLHLIDGTSHEVRHPELAILRFSVVWLHTPARDAPVPVGESRLIVDLNQIVCIDFLPPPASTPPAES